MSPADAGGPVRTCVGCRRARPVGALVRVTRPARGVVVGGPSDGRGAWLCVDADDPRRIDQGCVERAISKRAFNRAWRTEIDRDDEKNIREHTASFDDEHGEAP